MQVSVEITSSIERKLSIGVPSDEVDKIFQTKLKSAAKKVKINGFRPGKIPVSEIKKRYGKSIRRESITEIIDIYYRKAIEEQSIRPVGMPKIERVVDEPGTDFKFEAVVEVWPEINLPALEGLEINEPKCEVDEAAVEKMILKIRDDRADWVDAEPDHVVVDGNKVVIDFDGKVDGEGFEGGSAEGFELEIGSGKMIPGFEEGLKGAKVGDTPDVEVVFPDDYNEESLRGKQAVFATKVTACKLKRLPELDEAFVKSNQVESGSVDDFKNVLKENMERECDLALVNKFKQNVADALIEKADFRAPQVLVDEEANRMKAAAIRNLGGDPDKMGSLIPASMFSDQAEESVKKGILFQEFIKKFKLEVDESKVKERLEKMSQRYEDPAAIMQQFLENKEFLSSTRSQVLEDDFVDLVKNKATLSAEHLEFSELVENRRG